MESSIDHSLVFWATLTFKGMSFVAGLTIIAQVLLAYENEEKKFANYLERLWILLDDEDKKISSKISGYIKLLVDWANKLLDLVYGKKIVSLRTLQSAFLLQVGILTCVYCIFLFDELPKDLDDFLVYLGISLASLILPTTSYSKTRLVYTILLIGTIFFASLDLIIEFDTINKKYYSFKEVTLENFILVTVICSLAFIGEIIALSFSRLFFRRALTSKRFSLTLTWILLASTIAPLTILINKFASTFISEQNAGALYFFTVLNIVPLSASFAFFILLTGSVIIITIMTIIPRVLYSLIKTKIFESRKASLALGVLLIGFCYPEAVAILEKLAKPIG